MRAGARAPQRFLQRRQLQRGPKIVVLGGGTGLSTLLRGLKRVSTNLTAIVVGEMAARFVNRANVGA